MSLITLSRLSNTAHRRGIWRWSVSILAALCFLLVVSSSASHIHKNSASLQNCAVCAVVADKLADVPVPPALVHDIAQQPYRLFAATVHLASYSTVDFLPPGCGPPRVSV
jgi:hypothetical protein